MDAESARTMVQGGYSHEDVATYFAVPVDDVDRAVAELGGHDFAAAPELDDDTPTVLDLLDLLSDVVAALDGLVDQVAALRHETDDHGTRAELRRAEEDVQLAWANAQRAYHALQALAAVRS